MSIPGTDNVGCTRDGTSAPVSSGDFRRKLARYRHRTPFPNTVDKDWDGGTGSTSTRLDRRHLTPTAAAPAALLPAAAASTRFHHGQLGWQGDSDMAHERIDAQGLK